MAVQSITLGEVKVKQSHVKNVAGWAINVLSQRGLRRQSRTSIIQRYKVDSVDRVSPHFTTFPYTLPGCYRLHTFKYYGYDPFVACKNA